MFPEGRGIEMAELPAGTEGGGGGSHRSLGEAGGASEPAGCRGAGFLPSINTFPHALHLLDPHRSREEQEQSA